MFGPALEWHRRGPPRPMIDGDLLVAELGIEPGPQIGRLLAEIEAAQYAGEVSTPAEALDLARGFEGSAPR
jgi:poly(A) polymerase